MSLGVTNPDHPPPPPITKCCLYCWGNSGIRRLARYTAAQSIDRGKNQHWVLICEDHADGWNDGGDWNAPVIELED